jgi:hypothetical protein
MCEPVNPERAIRDIGPLVAALVVATTERGSYERILGNAVARQVMADIDKYLPQVISDAKD